jgi:hypothetical protein
VSTAEKRKGVAFYKDFNYEGLYSSVENRADFYLSYVRELDIPVGGRLRFTGAEQRASRFGIE